jgi:hypothetical protein
MRKSCFSYTGMSLKIVIIKTQELVMCLWLLFCSHCYGTAKTGYFIATLHTETEKEGSVALRIHPLGQWYSNCGP